VKKRYMVVLGLVGALAAAQFVRPARGNPPTVEANTIASDFGKSSRLVGVLDRSCNECHSNSTEWPWYTEIAPISWLAVSGVREARQSVNFSDWGLYSPEKQRQVLQASCAAATKGTMPGSYYTAIEPRSRLSADDIRTICGAAHQRELTSLEVQP